MKIHKYKILPGFDTSPKTYPSIFGTHKGTIKPNHGGAKTLHMWYNYIIKREE